MATIEPHMIMTVMVNRIVQYDVIARDNIGELELMVNQMIGYGWQPYGTPITTHGFWYQPMVFFEVKSSEPSEDLGG